MMKISSFVIFFCILYESAAGTETNTKGNVYYKQTAPTAASKAKPVLKDEIPIVMEGEPPLTEAKLKLTKFDSVREIEKKEGKTVPKKGVSLNTDKLSEKVDQTDHLLQKPVEEQIKPVVEKINITETTKKPFTDTSKIPTSTQKISTLHLAPVHEIVENITYASTTKTVKTPKPKPIVTIGEKDADGPIPASPTNKSPLGVPRKIDYIVPVVITVTALPLLGVAFYVLYKRGRDYWDKRHYRRMDFLIDGMYNE